jgi:mycofactocin precursor
VSEIQSQPVPEDAAASHAPVVEAEPEPKLVEADLLVEDVSIDGLCGVY